MNVKKIKKIGNLKFINNDQDKLIKLDKTLLKSFKNKKIWCASSTHELEEIICSKVHLIHRREYKNLLTIIIPRHIHRINKIVKEIENLKLNVIKHSSNKKILKKY